VTPPDFDVRDRVHEYGGAAYAVDGEAAWCSRGDDGRIWRVPLDEGEGPEATAGPEPLTPEGPFRYADIVVDASRRRLVCVREDHSRPDVANELVSIAFEGPERGQVRVLVSGPDFVAAPRISPDGERIAWIAWNHPAMPWDATSLNVARLDEPGLIDGEPAVIAGGASVDSDERASVVRPAWSSDGSLFFVADWTGWWNLYLWVVADQSLPVAPVDAELADPEWKLGASSYAFIPGGSIIAALRRAGRDHLVRIPAGADLIELIPQVATEIDDLRPLGERVAYLAGAPGRPDALVILDPRTGAEELVRSTMRVSIAPELVSTPSPLEIPSVGGRTIHALWYPPRNPAAVAPDGERPPLIVTCHGGPTGNASTRFDPFIQLFTSRGYAYLDVDFTGSSGYGRDYRRGLDGGWGVADVDDLVAAARHAAELGLADRDRIILRGGSAGGFTVLAALAFRPGVFAGGMSRYGIADLELLAQETHKFESHYHDRLIAPYPEAAAVYRERSPIHAADRIDVPVLILQGLDDRVVPPSQAEAIVAAMRARGLPHAYIAYPGEAHGFRGAEAVTGAANAELAFCARILGLPGADSLEPLRLSTDDSEKRGASARR
jgi:dipeptidyl aminopeptidase/acylaminoacyl peptidase